MKIKTVIKRADTASVSLIFGFVFALMLVFDKSRNTWWEYAAEWTLGACALGGFLYRLILLPWALKHSEDPDLLYTILDKLGMTYILFSNFTPTTEYRPTYLNSQFLTDNDLATEIGAKRTRPRTAFPGLLPALAIYAFLIYLFKMNWGSILFIGVFLGIASFTVLKSWRKAADPIPILSFTEQEIRIYQHHVPWKNIYNWAYKSGGEGESNKIIINHYGPQQNVEETIVKLDEFDIHRVDFLLLLLYFKAKFG